MPDYHRALTAAALLLGSTVGPGPAAPDQARGPSGGFSIEVRDTEHGLPQNSVIAMTQTPDGYLWLGTLKGLVRYDGLRFTVFDEGNTPGVVSSRIVHVFADSRSNLWVGTESAGVMLISDGRVTAPPELAPGGAARRLVASCEAPDGAVWLLTANGELWRHQDARFTAFVLPSQPSRVYRALMAERSGPVWVASDGAQHAVGEVGATEGLPALPVAEEIPLGRKLDFLLASRQGGYWRLADNRIQRCWTNYVEREWQPYPPGLTDISAACEDDRGNLVVGTRSAGVFWFDAEGQATVLSTNNGLSHNFILSLMADREGTLWVGTDGGGLNRVRRQVFDVLEVSRGLVVQSVSEDATGGLWIGYNNGGVDRWLAGSLLRFSPASLGGGSVKSVLADGDGRLWVGLAGFGLFVRQNGPFQQLRTLAAFPTVVHALHQDGGGRLWLGSPSGLVCWDRRQWRLYTTRDGLSADAVRAIADDAEGNLWVGTERGGLNRLRDGQFSAVSIQPGAANEDISALFMDATGVLWVGTENRGLARLHRGRWTRYTKRDGLASDSVSYLLEDDENHLWIGSNAGLMRAAKRSLNDFALGLTNAVACRVYDKADGLPTRECTAGSQPAACRTRDGRLWFPTIRGLATVNPAELAPNTNPPPVVIETVLIDDQLQNPNSLRAGAPASLTVPARRERVEIRYTSLNLAAADRARFRYRLEGHEMTWTDAGSLRVAHYSKLPPGRFRFQVTACNEDGVWNDLGASLSLTVQPPFWRTWWFLTATAAGLLGVLVAVVHYFSTQKLQRQLAAMRQQEALEKERARIARDLHDQLGANLTQVALLGEMVESDKHLPAEVAVHARQIAGTARDTTRALDEIVWAANPANDTLEGLANYACKYAQEYLALAGVRYRIDVPSQLPSTPLAPEVRHNVFLAFKEAVNNVVKHAQATSARVRLRLEPAAFSLEVEDNGRGLSPADLAKGRNGLPNMRRRMEDVGGRFSIGPAAEGGVRVCLTVPLRQH